MSAQDDRRDSGYRMQDSRRAIGDRMIKDRADIKAGISAARASTFKADLNALETSPRKQITLTKREAKGTRAATVGTGIYKAPAATAGTGGGIASPLTEASAAERVYWPSGLMSSDQLFELPSIKTLNLTDANGDAVVIQLDSAAGML